jgi:hypothetical protein
MDPEVLFTGYLRILKTIYTPDRYYDRVFNALTRQDRKAPSWLPTRGLPPLTVLALALATAVNIGFKAPYRTSWWKFMARIARNHPARVPQALINSVVGHHFIRYTRELIEREAGQVITVQRSA